MQHNSNRLRLTWRLKQYQKSLDYINELNDREYRYKKALALFNLERYDESISEARNLKTPEAYKLIARSYEKLNKPSKAVRYMFRSYELDENTETLFGLPTFIQKTVSTTDPCMSSEEYLKRTLKTRGALKGL